MFIDTVTITGLGNETPNDVIYNLSDEYNFVEWGILLYPEKTLANNPRYPLWSKVLNFLRHKPKYVKCALHICGNSSINQFIDCNNWTDTYINNLLKFDRLQLNLTYNSNDYDIFNAIYKFITIQKNKNKNTHIILQENDSNNQLNQYLSENLPTPHNILFDSSHGQGIELYNSWCPPYKTMNCGYAGGITPENIHDVINKLCDIVPYDTHIWIDMESGVRTNNKFDLVKVENILDIIYGYKYEY